MVFHWSLSDTKSPQVSRTHLRILAILSNAVIWIASTRPPTYKSSRPFIIIIIIIIIIIASFKFFTPVLASSLSLDSLKQLVPSALFDFSAYSSRSQQYCRLDDFDLPIDFHFLQYLFHVPGDCCKRANYKWYFVNPHVSQLL